MARLSDDLKSNRMHIIAEIGINHNGNLDLCLEMIKSAKENGADSVKFQKRNPEVCVPDSQKNTIKDTPWGTMTYLEYKNKLEFGRDEYLRIDEFCKELKIDWSASPWDLDSLFFLDNFDLDYIKVASALATHTKFLLEVAQREKTIVASTGMCTWTDIDKMVEIFASNSCNFILMHTVSTYPAKEEYLNLLLIDKLKERYGVAVGYSAHESSLTPCVVAAARGAQVIERHFTLDRSMWGTDQSASVEPLGLKQLSGALKKVSRVLGDGHRHSVPGEEDVARKLRYW